MIKRWYTFWGAGILIVLGALFLKNKHDYKNQSKKWLLSKSFLELGVIIIGMVFMPGILVAMGVAGIVAPIKNSWAKLIVGVAASIALSVISAFASEVLIVTSIFSIDLRTGDRERGVLRHWRESVKKNEAITHNAA